MTRYTDEIQAQIVIALLKEHGIRRVIASPGSTNIAFVGSIQSDPFFDVFSAVDERSAAYMACGLAAETGAPVVLSCTGATASRNYLPALTEAFYRKLPILALTSMQGRARAGHHIAQVIDRSSPPVDAVRLSLDLPLVKDAEELWECEVKVNRALLELSRRGGGPVHLNLPTSYSNSFRTQHLPSFRRIDRWEVDSTEWPRLTGRIGLMIGAHRDFDAEETALIERFCEVHDAVAFCDHTSGYHGKYRLLSALIGAQEGGEHQALRPDIMIHLGEISGDYESIPLVGEEVWRVSPDGEIRDTWRRLRHVFEMSEGRFLRHYAQGTPRPTATFETCQTLLQETRAKLPELPFSNIWLAAQLAHRLPEGSVIHFAILNSLRAWNFFDLAPQVRSAANTGGFGIDGCTSALIGASLADPTRPYYLVTGDLAFFYDMNALGNRHVGPNLRILLVNNGKGTEFTQYRHWGENFGAEADRFIAADGHFGQKSRSLVRGYAESLGFHYLAASSKSEIAGLAEAFLAPEIGARPLLVEAFVEPEAESTALRLMKTIVPAKEHRAKRLAKEILGPQGIKAAKRILGR